MRKLCSLLFNRYTAGLWLYSFSIEVFADPVTAFVAANAGAISLAGTAVSVIGAISQSRTASQSSKYNAEIANQNAVASRQQAAANAEAADKEARKRLGAIEANVGASGIAMEGSPLDILKESARTAEMDRLNIIYGGEVRATGYGNTAALESSRCLH